VEKTLGAIITILIGVLLVYYGKELIANGRRLLGA
jgi:hypothetical protein